MDGVAQPELRVQDDAGVSMVDIEIILASRDLDGEADAGESIRFGSPAAARQPRVFAAGSPLRPGACHRREPAGRGRSGEEPEAHPRQVYPPAGPVHSLGLDLAEGQGFEPWIRVLARITA